MRTLADIFAGMLFFAGLLITAAGFLTVWHPVGGVFFWAGVALMIAGILIYRVSGRKTCPQCAERVKYEAKKCKHCGSELAAPPRSSASAPVYKGKAGKSQLATHYWASASTSFTVKCKHIPYSNMVENTSWR